MLTLRTQNVYVG